MNHLVLTKHGIEAHGRTRDGAEMVTPVASIRLTCDRCGWSTLAVKGDQRHPTHCNCGGALLWQPEKK